MKLFKGASEKSPSPYRVIARHEQVRILNVHADSEDQALEIALSHSPEAFTFVKESFYIDGILLLDDTSPVRYFDPIAHTPRSHDEY